MIYHYFAFYYSDVKDSFHSREKINAVLIHMDNTGISVSFVNSKDKHLMPVAAFKKLREK